MFDKETQKEIVAKYNSGISSIKLASEYGVTLGKIAYCLKINNVVMRSNKENSKKYHCKDSIFHDIDSHEKAYWLGFIAADGYVSSGYGKRLGVTLAQKDRPHLEKLKRFLGYTGEIREYRYSGYADVVGARLLVASDQIYDDLVSHGVVEHKSDIIQPPDIDDEYKSSWILGYFDGDGSLYKTDSYYSLKFIGTDSLLDWFIEFFVKNGIDCAGKPHNKRHKDDSVSYLSFGGVRKVYDIMSLLYQSVPDSVPMERKYTIYKELKSRLVE